MGHGETSPAVRPSQIVIGVTAEAAPTLGPGEVDHPGRAVTFVGPLRGRGSRPPSGLPASSPQPGSTRARRATVATEIWKKLVLGASTLAAPALLGMNCGEADARTPRCARLVDDDRSSRSWRSPGRSATTRPATSGSPTSHELLAGCRSAKGSMVQDVEAGRPTEIDFINGAVVRAAGRAGVPAPINRALRARQGLGVQADRLKPSRPAATPRRPSRGSARASSCRPISGCLSRTCASTPATISSSSSPRTTSPHGQLTCFAISSLLSVVRPQAAGPPRSTPG